jgi:ADP-L-glycero-D-manno-heptose 6-epimerase
MIVVTGGAGFIGSNLVAALNRRGHRRILVVDNLLQGEKHRNLNLCEFADLIDEDEFLGDFEEWADEIEVVFHQGAITDTLEGDGRYMMQQNYKFSQSLALNCLEHGVRMIYASSAAVYGDGRSGFRPSIECEYPLNVYAYSKFLFDQWVRQNIFAGEHTDENRLWSGRTHPQMAGLRYFNVYGPQENHKGRMASVVAQFHKQWKELGHLELFEGSDEIRRDFIHVDDVVAANLFVLDNPELSGIYNVGTGNAESFRTVAETAAATWGGVPIETIPFPEELAAKYQRFTCADISGLRAVGFDRGFLEVREGVRRYATLLQETGGFLPHGMN